MQLLVGDIGGTHARFALASFDGDQTPRLENKTKFSANEFDSFESVLSSYARSLPVPLPGEAAFALATDISGDVVTLTNRAWVIDRHALIAGFGFDSCTFCNDFEAVGHVVAAVGKSRLLPILGPSELLPQMGSVSIIGPGTGLGVAQLVLADDHYHVLETEGGHIGFAPSDEFETRVLNRARAEFGRVSIERIVAGPGLMRIYRELAGTENAGPTNDADLWQAALDNSDLHAAQALDRFLGSLGSAAGDIVLAQGANALVLAGGLAGRFRVRLADSPFAERFVAKGRFENYLRAVPVSYLDEPDAGLIGAALAGRISTPSHH